jgi:hypothetical protein
MIMLRVNKLKVLVGLQNQGQDYLERIFGECFSHAHSLSTKERSEAHRVVMCLTFFKPLRSVNIMVGAPLILIVMKLMNIYQH